MSNARLLPAQYRPLSRIRVTNLSAQRGGRTVFSRLSFEVKSGEALLVTGANGAGKTTLLRSLAGFLPPHEGTISFEGGDPESPLVAQSHYIGHANGLKETLTVEENLAFWARYLDGPRAAPKAALAGALERFALTKLARLPVRYLSAGQKRRAGLARLLAACRPLWLLDEPTASLDAPSAALAAAAVNAHLATGGLVIAATHLPLGITPARELRLVP